MKMLIRVQWSLFLSIILYVQGRDAILCNSCRYAGPGYDYNCVTNSANETLQAITCNNACLTTVQTVVDSNALYFVERGCQANELQGCDGHPSLDTCNYICNDTDLCNDENHEPIPVSSTTTIPWTGTTTVYTEAPGTINCYSCVYSYHPETPQTCIDAPEDEGRTVRCPPSRACTIFRQWDKGENVVRSFSRDCLAPPTPMANSCVPDTQFISYYTYCKSELCNTGNGEVPCPPPSGGNGGGGGPPGRAVSSFTPSINLLIAAAAATDWLNKYCLK